MRDNEVGRKHRAAPETADNDHCVFVRCRLNSVFVRWVGEPGILIRNATGNRSISPTETSPTGGLITGHQKPIRL